MIATSLRRAAALLAPVALSVVAPAVRAQGPTADSTAVDSARATPAATAHAAGGLAQRFAFHGYITEGVAQSTGPAFYGISHRASADFRYAAVQARFRATEKDLFLVQLNHRRLGDSPITALESAVNVNWAFYQRSFGDGTTMRVGRVAIPRGIYNELRSVGVSLPMYRPPVTFYDEGAYYSETIDGVVASRTFGEDAPWSVEAHAYGGGWRPLVYDTWSETYSVMRVRAERALGAQLWLHTPAEGVRVGLAAQRFTYDYRDGSEPFGQKEWHVSLDATRERGFVRAEGQLQNYGSDKFYGAYVQLGARLVSRLSGVVEVQRSRDTDVKYGESLPESFDWHRSDGVGLSYAFAPNLVLKAEHHWDRGVQLEQPADPRWPPRFRYAIASLSASF